MAHIDPRLQLSRAIVSLPQRAMSMPVSGSRFKLSPQAGVALLPQLAHPSCCPILHLRMIFILHNRLVAA
jgi:hypothetical protein